MLQLYMSSGSVLCCGTAVFMLWLGLCTQPSGLGLENVMFWLKTPVLVTMNMVGGVPRSRQSHLFVATTMAEIVLTSPS